MKKNLTIVDIAQLSGVSKSTVSRVLNNEPKVKPDTKERVLQVIEENGYFPNELARTLVRSKSKLIGLIRPFQSRTFYQSAFFRDIFVGIGTQLKEFDYDIITASGYGNESMALKRFTQTYHTCGMILLYSIPDDPSIHYLQKNQIPFSLVGACEGFSGVNQVAPDFHGAIMQIVDDLVQRGYKRIALWFSDPLLATERSYIQGYYDVMKAHGLSVYPDDVISNLYTQADTAQALRRRRSGNHTSDAIIVGSEFLCCNLLRCGQELGLRIPEDLAIFSLENTSMNDIYGISALELDYVGMGATVARILLDMIGGAQPVQIHPGFQILHRASTNAHGTSPELPYRE